MAELGFETKPIYRLEPSDQLQDLVDALQKTDEPLAIFMDHVDAQCLEQGQLKTAARIC